MSSPAHHPLPLVFTLTTGSMRSVVYAVLCGIGLHGCSSSDQMRVPTAPPTPSPEKITILLKIGDAIHQVMRPIAVSAGLEADASQLTINWAAIAAYTAADKVSHEKVMAVALPLLAGLNEHLVKKRPYPMAAASALVSLSIAMQMVVELPNDDMSIEVNKVVQPALETLTVMLAQDPPVVTSMDRLYEFLNPSALPPDAKEAVINLFSDVAFMTVISGASRDLIDYRVKELHKLMTDEHAYYDKWDTLDHLRDTIGEDMEAILHGRPMDRVAHYRYMDPPFGSLNL